MEGTPACRTVFRNDKPRQRGVARCRQSTDEHFRGPCNQIARLAGRGTTTFGDCNFSDWDAKKQGRHAIQVESGTVVVRGCDFQRPKARIELKEGVRRAIITSNVISGPMRIINNSKGSVRIAENVESDEKPLPSSTAPSK